MPIKLKVSGMPDNEMRAMWASLTLKHYHSVAAVGLVEGNDDTAINATQDLLTDFFHLLDTLVPKDCHEINKWDVVQKAMDMYQVEVKEEADEQATLPPTASVKEDVSGFDLQRKPTNLKEDKA